MKNALIAISTGFLYATAALGVSLKFADYPALPVYTGPVAQPQFKGRDKDWRRFRTRIRAVMAAGATYAGEVSVIQTGCGTGCSFITLANVRTGELYPFPRGWEDCLYLQVHTLPTSTLMVAQWQGRDGCHLEHYLWTGKGVKLLKDSTRPSLDDCLKDIVEHLP
jgi:hypothetical protein